MAPSSYFPDDRRASGGFPVSGGIPVTLDRSVSRSLDMTRRRTFAMAIALGSGLLPVMARPAEDSPADARASTGAKRMVLVELFTSQG